MNRILLPLLRLAVRAHPSAWRRRYDAEMAQLIDDLDARPSDLGDLLRSALGSHLSSIRSGGLLMPSTTNPWPARLLAGAALVLAAWTAVFIGFNVLRYNLGVAVPDFLAWTYATNSPIPAMLGVLGPAVIGLGLAVAGMARVTRHRSDGASAFLVRVRPTRLTIVAAVACVAVVLVILGYVVGENLLEVRR